MIAPFLLALALQTAAPAAASCPPASPTAASLSFEKDEADIRATIAAMEAAWNRGDFSGYMAGFADPGVVFVSNGRIQDGWQGTLDHYERDYGGAPERRGVLHFYEMTIERLGPDAAMLIGHYRLERPERAQEGINTRLFRKIGGRWVIAMNHVSSFDPNEPKK